MKTVLRFLVTSVGLILIILALGVILAGTQMGPVANAVIAHALAYVYQTDVTIDRVSFMPHARALQIEGLTIHNPPPFQKGQAAIHVGELAVYVDPVTLLSAKPVVREVVMRQAKFYLRYEAGHGTNFGKLDENAQRFKTTKKSPSGLLVTSREYVIKSFRSEKAVLDISAGFVPGPSLKLELAPFTMEDLSSNQPVSTAQLASLFVRSVLRESLTLRGLIKPVADTIDAELSRLRGHDNVAPQPSGSGK